MRSAFRPVLAVLAGVFLLASRPAAAADQAVNIINGIGLVDYGSKPTFKVGDWVRYRMSGSSEGGMSDDYTITLLVAGEESFWGDPGVWIETWTEFPNRPPEAIATLMSYSIFTDSLAIPRMQMYMRKSVNTMDDKGRPIQQIMKRASASLKSRNLAPKPPQWDLDTLGVDTVVTPRGTFDVKKVSIRQGTGAEQVVGDSTIYNEQRENRLIYYADEVPITHVAREDVESIVSRRSYMIGRSKDAAPMRIRDKANGVARLIDFGHGLEARITPPEFRSTIAEQERAAARTASGTVKKPASTAGNRRPVPRNR